MFSTMFHLLMWTNLFYYTLDIRFDLSLFVNLTSHFSNFANFRQLQIPNAQTKYYDIYLLIPNTQYNSQIDILNLNTTFWHCKENIWLQSYISSVVSNKLYKLV